LGFPLEEGLPLNFSSLNNNKNNGCASHTVGLPFTLKKYLKKAKEGLWKLKYSTIAKVYVNLQKNPLKETQNPSRYYYNSIN
jgi:hypothetical protein